MVAQLVRVVPLLLFSPALVAQSQTTTAITGARVLDGTGAPVRVQTAIIRDDPIVAVSDRVEILSRGRC